MPRVAQQARKSGAGSNATSPAKPSASSPKQSSPKGKPQPPPSRESKQSSSNNNIALEAEESGGDLGTTVGSEGTFPSLPSVSSNASRPSSNSEASQKPNDSVVTLPSIRSPTSDLGVHTGHRLKSPPHTTDLDNALGKLPSSDLARDVDEAVSLTAADLRVPAPPPTLLSRNRFRDLDREISTWNRPKYGGLNPAATNSTNTNNSNNNGNNGSGNIARAGSGSASWTRKNNKMSYRQRHEHRLKMLRSGFANNHHNEVNAVEEITTTASSEAAAPLQPQPPTVSMVQVPQLLSQQAQDRIRSLNSRRLR